MFLPLGDEPNPRGVPVVTYGLIGVNVLVYLVLTLPLSSVRPDLDDPRLVEYVQLLFQQLSGRMALSDILQRISAYELVTFSYGYRPAAPSVIGLFTSMFLHGGFMHLAGNMLFLWIYGDNVEHRLGPSRFLVAYLAAGIAATLFHALFDADSLLPVVGASGAISGVLGFYFIWFPRNRVRLLVFFFFFAHIIYAPARLVLGFYLIVQNVLPFLAARGLEGGGVAYGAHIGGFIAGLGSAWWADRRGLLTRPPEYATGSAPTTPAVSAREAVARLVAGNRFDEAADEYFRLTPDLSRRALSPVHSIALSNWLANHRHPDAALVVYQRHLRDYPMGPYAAEAHLGAGLVQLHARNQPTAAYQHLIAVFDLEPHSETERHARSALANIAGRQKFQVGRVH